MQYRQELRYWQRQKKLSRMKRGVVTMEYIAHKDNERVQTVKEHLYGTAELAGFFAERFGKKEWGYCCGMLHDLGKYSKEFQRKIRNDTGERVDHSTAGAKVCNEKGGYYSILSYCIAGHHAGLPDYGNTAIGNSLCGRYNKKICDFKNYEKEIEIPQLHTDPIVFDPTKNLDFSLSVFVRMLYSCLVDADFLDTEAFMKNENTGRVAGETMQILEEKLEQYIEPWLSNTELESINGRRTEILAHCMEMGKREKGIYRLTVPTGGGKTIASLAFALRHAVKHQMDRIIYVIPYTSIIEQNAQVFREILGAENVLENHCNVEYKDSEEFYPMQLASENWDKPVVVTTNVQFFESLFGNKSSKCRKIHNIANSVVIFDEAQMLPMDYLKPCISVLQELVDNYASSIVLCTATQPALEMFFSSKDKMIELCPCVEEQFRFFERVTYEKIGKISQDELIMRMQGDQSILCIVNTKKAAQELYKKLREERKNIYHLSTNMYPKHRKRVLKLIRERLDNNEKCIVVSTSLVEAGVDLDFDIVYRQIAGLDSLIQAAGRCNRNGKKDLAKSKVYIFDFIDEKKVTNQKLQIETAASVLQDYEKVDDLTGISDYFKRLYHYRGTSLDKKNIMGEFKQLRFNFSKVAKEFKLIEENTKMIYINKELKAEELLNELKTKGASKERLREAGQYCVQIYGDERNENSLFDKLYSNGMLRPISEDMQDFYELMSQKQYSDEWGLDFSVDDVLMM